MPSLRCACALGFVLGLGAPALAQDNDPLSRADLLELLERVEVQARAEREALKAQLQETQGELRQATQQVNVLTQELAQAWGERDQLRSAVAERDSAASLRLRIDSLQAQLSEQGQTLDSAETQLARLQAHYGAVVEQRDAAETQAARLGAHYAALVEARDALADELASAQEDLATMAVGTQVASAPGDKLPLGAGDGDQTQIQLARLQAHYGAVVEQRDAAETQLARLQAHYGALREQSDRTETQLARLQAHYEALADQRRSTATQLARLQAHYGALRDRLEGGASTSEVAAQGPAVDGPGEVPETPAATQTAAVSPPPQPAASSAGGAGRTVVVQAGDSLSRIANRVYGDFNRWREIYDANRDKLRNPNAIEPGMELQVP
ncbi:MAG: LysM peptidoglycan-binding domain-containing protein [Candidatus Competibacterales bacterium]